MHSACLSLLTRPREAVQELSHRLGCISQWTSQRLPRHSHGTIEFCLNSCSCNFTARPHGCSIGEHILLYRSAQPKPEYVVCSRLEPCAWNSTRLQRQSSRRSAGETTALRLAPAPAILIETKQLDTTGSFFDGLGLEARARARARAWEGSSCCRHNRCWLNRALLRQSLFSQPHLWASCFSGVVSGMYLTPSSGSVTTSRPSNDLVTAMMC